MIESFLITHKTHEIPSKTLYKIYQVVTKKEVKYPPVRKSYNTHTFG